MKKKRLVQLGISSIAAVVLLLGCGTNKNLNPASDLKLEKADPPSINVGVNPPSMHQVYFPFLITHGDTNLSLISSDSWTVERVSLTYEVLSDPGHHLLAPPSDDNRKVGMVIHPGTAVRVPVVLVSDTYLQENAQGFIGTSDTAAVKVRLVFQAHRNKDGFRKTLSTRYYFNIGNY